MKHITNAYEYDPGNCSKKNDIVTVFSNGGFDGIHEKLLSKLKVERSKS